MPTARNTDPATSHEAAASVRGLTMKQWCVEAVLRSHGPMTDQEIAREYEYREREFNWPFQSPSGLRTRRKELCDQGLVRQLRIGVENRSTTHRVGDRMDEHGFIERRLASGRWGIVWEAVSAA